MIVRFYHEYEENGCFMHHEFLPLDIDIATPACYSQITAIQMLKTNVRFAVGFSWHPFLIKVMRDLIKFIPRQQAHLPLTCRQARCIRQWQHLNLLAILPLHLHNQFLHRFPVRYSVHTRGYLALRRLL